MYVNAEFVGDNCELTLEASDELEQKLLGALATTIREREQYAKDAERLAKENAALLRLMAPGLHVYAGNYVVQIDAGKLGLFTERFTGDDDKQRALRVVQQAAIAAATVGANTRI